MRFISTFSGVEAASVAWGRLGWEPLMYSEVEPFACAVLANRFPNVPNYGDICKIDWREVHERFGIVDVYIGGSPCQDFSIAGNRLGLLGDKSRLMYEYIRGIRELVEASGGQSPRYVVFENVPGALSSGREGAKGSDFGCLLRELDECGYSCGWRVLDAQFARVPDGSPGGFFGPVAQRRRRVFLVGVLGSPNAAEILFERQSLRGDNPPSREARKRLAGDSEEGPGARGSAGFCRGNSPAAGGIGYQDEMSPTLRAGESGTNMVPGVITAGFKWYAGAKARGIGYEDGTSPTIAVSDSHVPAVLTPWDVQSKRIMSPSGTCPTLQSGSGEGMTIQPCVIQPVISVSTANTNSNGSNINEEEVSYTLDGANSNAVAFAQNSRDEVRYVGEDGSVIGALAAQPGMKQTSYVMANAVSETETICMQDGQSKGTIAEDGTATTLNASHKNPIVCMGSVDCRNLELKHDISGTLQAKENGGYSLNYQNQVMVDEGEYVVRRLMPVETERLQGFPDGWTDLTGCDAEGITRKVAEALGHGEGTKEYKKLLRDVSKWSKECPDTPRYKAMGNSIATPCLMWIGRRIEAFDILHYDEVGL